MIKLILGALSSIFLIVSITIIYYWRDIQYDPSSLDLLSYFIVLPLVLSLILLSPYLIYQAYHAYKLRKQQQAIALLEQQSNKEIPEANEKVENVKCLNLHIFSSSAFSAFGENEAIIDEMKNFKSPELDHSLTNGDGLPVLSYRITALDNVLEQQNDEEEMEEKQERLQRILALIQHQLEQQSEILLQVAEHLKQSAFFYDSELAYQYRMHTAWNNLDFSVSDPTSNEEKGELQVEQIPRLNRLNIHILLSDSLLHVWNEHFSEKMLLNFMQSLGIISQHMHIEHYFINQQSSYENWLNLLKKISTQSHEVSLMINVDSEIDQEWLDEKIWLSDHYLATEFASSWCVAAQDLKINDAEPIKSLKIAFNVHDLAACLDQAVPHHAEYTQHEQPFVLVLNDATDIRVIKQTNQIFAPILIETYHLLYTQQNFGHTQSLAKIFSFMLGVHMPKDLIAMVHSIDQVSTHAIFQAVAGSNKFEK